MAGLQKEKWSAIVLETLRATSTFLSGVPDFSKEVRDNKFINITDLGINPTVLVDTVKKAIPVVEQPDGNLRFDLHKLDTVNTPIHEESLYAISYDRIKRAAGQHAAALEEEHMKLAAYYIAPTVSTDLKTHFVPTSGTANAEGNKKITVKDVAALKRKFNKAKVPAKNRHLVLCDKHVQELLESSEAFEKQYSLNNTEGRITRLYGFDIHEYVDNPLFYNNGGVITKRPYGKIYDDATDFEASFAFYGPYTMRAMADIQMYHKPLENNTDTRQHEIGFSDRFIGTRLKAEGVGIIYEVPSA